MPWCPICKTEYREGFSRCSDCEVDLVEEIKEDVIRLKQDEDNSQQIDWEYLDIFIDEQEASMIESFLNSDNILTWKKYPGFSDITKIVGGTTRLGVAIYVPKNRLADARLIVEDILERDGGQEQADEYSKVLPAEPDIYRRTPYSKTIILFLVIAFLYLVFSR